ncbi:MAG: hypothetical protein ACRBB6_04250 [Neptuniibacter sp.]
MTTRNVTLNGSTYTSVTTADAFLFQNTSKLPVQALFSTVTPDASLVPHTLNPGDGLTRNGLTGDLYMRSTNKSGDTLVTVTE